VKKKLTLVVLSTAFHAGFCWADQPPVNLGMTSFLDGAMPPGGPGLYFQNYLSHYHVNELKDENGNRSPLAQQKLNLDVDMLQVAYFSPTSIASARLGWTVLVPTIVRNDVELGPVPTPGGPVFLKGSDGLGDAIVGAILQFDTVVNENGPVFAQRVEVDVNLPTGRYDRNRAVNPGANLWSFNPYWAGTYWFSPQWSASIRLHYLYNGKNNDGPGGVTIQPGQAIHANFATEYAVLPNLRIGLNGYWLNQFTDTKIDGVSRHGQRDRVWAIGPGLLYSFSKDNGLFVNSYVERGVRNTGQGSRVVVRYAHHF
jgi:hypothetical protein